MKKDKAERAHLTSTLRAKTRARKRRKIKKLQIQHFKRTNERSWLIQKVLVVSSVKLKGMRRSIEPIITRGMIRRICFLF